MHLDESESYAATVEQVVAVLIDPQFQRRKATAVGATDFDMQVDGSDELPHVTTRRRLPTSGLPEFVKALVRPTMLVEEREVWDVVGPELGSASFEVDVDGAPIRVRGRLDATADGDGSTTVRFSGELQSTVPLFRKQVETAASGEVLRTIRTELSLLRASIADHAESE